MDKVWLLAIGTVLITYNYDKANGTRYEIPKFYRGKEVRILSTRDWPPSIVIPSITKDDGDIEILDKRVIYPQLDFDTDRDRRGRAMAPTNWASAFQRVERMARNMNDVVAFPGLNVYVDRLRRSMLKALKQVLEQVLSSLRGRGKKQSSSEIRENKRQGRKILYALPPPKDYTAPTTPPNSFMQEDPNKSSFR